MSVGEASGRRLHLDMAVQLVGRVVNLALGVVVTVVVVRALGRHHYGSRCSLWRTPPAPAATRTKAKSWPVRNALRVLMPAFVVICFGYVAGSMVIVLRLQRVCVRFALLALVFNVALNLIFIPSRGYMAAAWITLATELLVEYLALRAVFRTIQMRVRLRRFARIVAAVAGMGLIIWALHSDGAGIVWLIACAAAVYPLLLLATRAVTRTDLAALIRQEAVG